MKTRFHSGTRSTLAVVAILLLSLSYSTYVKAEVEPMLIDVNHVVELKDGGTVIVTDNFNITNTGDAPISDFIVGFPAILKDGLQHFEATDANGSYLSVVRDVESGDQEIYATKVMLSNPIVPGSTSKISTKYVMEDLVSYGYEVYNVTFPAYPALATPARNCSSKVILPEEATFGTSSWTVGNSSLDSFIKTPLAPFSKEVGFVTFTGKVYLYRVIRATREISISGSGALKVVDTYYVRNFGRETMSKLSFILPEDAYGVEAFDENVPLTVNERFSQELLRPLAEITLVYPLRAFYFDAVEVKLSYSVQSSQVTERGDHKALDLRFDSGTDVTVLDFKVTTILPEGAKYVAGAGNLTERNSRVVISRDFGVLTPVQSVSLKAEYSYSIVWQFYRPATLIGLSLIAVASVLLYRRRREDGGIVPEPSGSSRVDATKPLVENREERTALELELESLEENVRRGSLKRQEYRRRRRNIDQRFVALSSRAEDLKADLRGIGARYSRLVDQIEDAEKEIESTLKDITNANEQYRSGAIDKKTFDQKMIANRQKLEKARSSIDATLMELRRESK